MAIDGSNVPQSHEPKSLRAFVVVIVVVGGGGDEGCGSAAADAPLVVGGGGVRLKKHLKIIEKQMDTI